MTKQKKQIMLDNIFIILMSLYCGKQNLQLAVNL